MAAQINSLLSQFMNTHGSTNQLIHSKNIPGNWSQATSTKSDTSGSDSAGSSSISANDFLTLLVTEMKNQDPTANTDPNEYINQLVQVNSLEQLISINQTLTSDSAATPSGGSVKAVGSQQKPPSEIPTHQEGNLTVPANNPSAQRIAESLGVKANS